MWVVVERFSERRGRRGFRRGNGHCVHVVRRLRVRLELRHDLRVQFEHGLLRFERELLRFEYGLFGFHRFEHHRFERHQFEHHRFEHELNRFELERQHVD
jgi:hypothetical protein